MKPRKNKNMVRISELAELAGVSLPTIKHYLNEGLIPKPVKTGKTMAYYDRSTVERILLIKKLQQEKFMPLEVIKRVIDFTADNEEEQKLNEVVLRIKESEANVPPVSEAYIERRTNYPLNKIKILENKGIICPTTSEDGKYYDATDLEIIEIMKEREETGFPFDYSLEIGSIYFEAMKRAMHDAILIFVKNVLDEAPLKRAIEMLGDHEASLDKFLVSVRRKLGRAFAQESFNEFKAFSDNISLLLFLPENSKELPDSPPPGRKSRIIYNFLSGNFSSVMHLIENERQKIKPLYAPASIITDVLRGDANSALETTKRLIPFPTARNMDNAAAALAYSFVMSESKGITEPMFYAKKALTYLKRIETTHDNDIVAELFCKYICGGLYSIFPSIFDTQKSGIELLRHVESLLTTADLKNFKLPEWLFRVIAYEIFPSVELRINRFLADCYIRLGLFEQASHRLEKVIDMADPGGEFSEWARLAKYRIEKNLDI